jgi:hypothetical protein
VEYFHTFMVAFPAANTSLVPISRGKRLVAYTPCSDHGRSLPHHSEKFFI